MDRLQELAERFKEEPLGKSLRAELDSLAAGVACVSVPVVPEMLIVDGMVQGGITTVVADFAGVYAAMSKIPSGHTPAMNISIDFLRPIRSGETMFAVAKVVQETRSSLWVDVEVRGVANDCKAQARIHFAKPKEKK